MDKKIIIRIRNCISESLETIFGLKYLNSFMRIRDPGWEKFGSVIREKNLGSGMKNFGSGINIPDPQHCRQAWIPTYICMWYTEGERGRYYRRDALGRVVPYKPVEHTMPGHLNAPYQGLMRYR
jgi:hypothetical protein